MTIQNTWSNISGSEVPALADGQIGIQQVDDILYTRKPDGSKRRLLLPRRVAVADAAFQARRFDTYIGVASLTASRTIALPAASAYPPGSPLTVADESGSCSPTVVLTIAANGTDKVNGVASVGLNSPYGEAVLISDGVSKWVANLPASGASNAVLYVAQSLTGGQQDQARSNVSGAMAVYQSATTTLTLLDFDRDEFVTGTSTLTMPSSVAPGWRSGIITNDNLVTGLVTLAVPSGHSLDGTTNGSTILFPFQRARLQLISAGTWRTIWVDRTPIVYNANITTPVASVDINIPAGYSKFRIESDGIAVTVNGSILLVRFSDNGTAGLKSGNADYANIRSYYSNSTSAPSGVNNTDAAGYFIPSIGAVGGQALRARARYQLAPGGTGLVPMLNGDTFRFDGTALATLEDSAIYYTTNTSGAIGRLNLMRLSVPSGTFTGNFTIWGES